MIMRKIEELKKQNRSIEEIYKYTNDIILEEDDEEEEEDNLPDMSSVVNKSVDVGAVQREQLETIEVTSDK